MTGRQDIRDLGTPASEFVAALPVAPLISGGVQGSVLFRGTRAWEILGPGTSGQLLTTQGPDKDVVWS